LQFIGFGFNYLLSQGFCLFLNSSHGLPKTHRRNSPKEKKIPKDQKTKRPKDRKTGMMMTTTLSQVGRHATMNESIRPASAVQVSKFHK
jgi:hypothetical protein